MKRFSDMVAMPFGAKYLLDELEPSSPSTRSYVMEREMMTSHKQIEAYRRRYDCIVSSDAVRIAARLSGLKNITHTLDRLAVGEVLDEVELFEVKRLAMISRDVSAMIVGTAVSLPSSERTIRLLDPDHTGVGSFYIYDSYDGRLAELRRRAVDPEGVAAVLTVEQQVRERLSTALQPEAEGLKTALQSLFEIDFMLAVGRQNVREGFTMPKLGNRTLLHQLVNPKVRAALDGRFQSVDIRLSARPTVLVGANMGGKSVTLRSVALAQTALQFGFGVAVSDDSEMQLFDEICFVADTTERGYSSFAAEMRAVDRVVRAVSGGEAVLALVDEPARTTNPVEGRALVEALIDVCRSERSQLFVATHYNLTHIDCDRLRVRGLVDGTMNYEIVTAQEGERPNEALAVAEQLGVDINWIENAKKRIENESKE